MAFASTNTLNESSMMVTKAGIADTVPFNTLKASTTDSWVRNKTITGPKLYAMKLDWASNDTHTLQKSIMDHAEYTLARTKYNFDKLAAYQATAYSVRDRTIERFNETQQYHTDTDPKRLYYLSLEFLMGRSLQNSIYNLGLKDSYSAALLELGYKLEDAYEEEKDAALGNGGLGRLAACFVDSMATLNYPCWGYGIRYHYGMFQQGIYDGFQTEMPDYWLSWGNPWELERIDVQYPVRFYGHVVEEYSSTATEQKYRWEGGELVQAVAYDTPVLGYKTVNCNNIRLWASRPSKEFDLSQFNEGNYLNAVEAKQRSENITSVLYPNDNTYSGKELRLKQQYFFVSATLSDVVRRFKKTHNDWNMFHKKVAIQLNDTHPTIGIVELLRKFLDEEGLTWDVAWNIITNVYAYTNHTVLPEALEMWSVSLIQHLLPRHMQLIYQINHRFLRVIEKKWPGDVAKMRRVSIIDEDGEKRVRMAHLAIVGSHAVNGVAAMHSEIVKTTVFPDFYDLWPQKFTNVTNGVTPRRWIQQANPRLTEILNRQLKSDNWPIELELLTNLRKFADDKAFQQEWKNMKLANKQRLAAYIHKSVGVQVNPNSLFDVHVKRIHEYKRQLMNILSVIYRYLTIKKASPADRKKIVPRVIIFAGKAAPGYLMAKRHIKLINSVAAVVNADSDVGDILKVVFLPNYNVSMAEVIVPGSDINQQISTAGTEASGTSNMKFAMNGSIIIGTLDGANVEIAEEVGVDNLFIFGLKAEQIEQTRRDFREGKVPRDPRLDEVYKAIQGGTFGTPEVFRPILDGLQVNDFYLVTPDFPLYLDCQDKVDLVWQNEAEWLKRSILNCAGTSKFSSDRSIHEYAKNIWNITPVDVPNNAQRSY